MTGTRCSTDFAEIPSTLMEYFASDPRVLNCIGRHYKTGEPIPAGEVDKFCAAKRIFSGVDIQSQLFYSLLDQQYHGSHPLQGSTTEILKQVQRSHHSLKYHPGTAWQLRFSHLVGYGARYYSYLMARSVASTIWQKYFAADPFDRSNGLKYRYHFQILSFILPAAVAHQCFQCIIFKFNILVHNALYRYYQGPQTQNYTRAALRRKMSPRAAD